MIEITRSVDQISILGNVIDLKPITKTTMKEIENMQSESSNLSFDDFEKILKLGIGEEAFNKVFPDEDSMDIEVMLQSALAVYEKFMDKNMEHIQSFNKKYSPNRAARRSK